MPSNFTAYEAPITEDALRALIDAAPNRALTIYVVHYEDKYETTLGDGLYLYFAWAYRQQEAALAACAALTEGFASYEATEWYLTYDPADGLFNSPVNAAAITGDWTSDY